METLKRKYIVNENNKKVAVQLDIKTFNKIEEVMENEPEYMLKLYNKIQLKSDYMIIIYHEQELSNHKGSELGQRLKVALKDFGMINYNAWNELL
jgi:hypothetical protein